MQDGEPQTTLAKGKEMDGKSAGPGSERSEYRRAVINMRRYLSCGSLSESEERLLSNCKAYIRFYERSHPDAVLISEGLNCSPAPIETIVPTAMAGNSDAQKKTSLEGGVNVHSSLNVMDVPSTTKPVTELSKDFGIYGDSSYMSKKRKERAVYRRACTIVRRSLAGDPGSLSITDVRFLIYRARIRSYERLNPDAVFLSEGLNCSPAPTETIKTIAPTPITSNNMNDTHPTIRDQGTHTVELTNQGSSSSNNPHRGKFGKRAGSGEEPLTSSKKHRKHGSLETDSALKVAVIDRADPDGKISRDNWRELEEWLIVVMADDSRNSGGVRFCGIDWWRGVKIIDCENNESVEFLKTNINGLEFWPGAMLEVVPQSSLPLRHIVSVWIPPPVLATDIIVKLLGKQNDGYNTQVWEVISTVADDKSPGLDVRIAIDAGSMEKLKACQGQLLFGFGFVKFRPQ